MYITYRMRNGKLIDIPSYLVDMVDDEWEIKEALKIEDVDYPQYEDLSFGFVDEVKPNFSRWWKYAKYRKKPKKFGIGRA